jgi:hypothetical protein
MDVTPQPENEPAQVLTLDQRSMRAALLYDEATQADPRTKIRLGDIANRENIQQTWVALASFIREHCPEAAQAVEDGTQTFFALEPMTIVRSGDYAAAYEA